MNACTGGYENLQIGRPCLDHHFYKLSLSDLRPAVEKIFKFMTNMITSKYKLRCSGGHEILLFGRPFFTCSEEDLK